MPPLEHDYWLAPDERLALDEDATGRCRCIGCGKFVADRRNWNQCSDCDTREPEEMR